MQVPTSNGPDTTPLFCLVHSPSKPSHHLLGSSARTPQEHLHLATHIDGGASIAPSARGEHFLMLQFVLLLGLFVKPLLAGVQGTQSGGALYRKVVWRNVICTVGIVITYAITTIVVFLALVRESLLNNKVRNERACVVSTSHPHQTKPSRTNQNSSTKRNPRKWLGSTSTRHFFMSTRFGGFLPPTKLLHIGPGD